MSQERLWEILVIRCFFPQLFGAHSLISQEQSLTIKFLHQIFILISILVLEKAMSATSHDIDSQGPLPMHVCLSGGGFRASFFHLGALYALAEQGRLHRLELITSVSGGSIAAAMFLSEVAKLPEKSLFGHFDLTGAIVRAFRKLIRHTRSSPRHKAIGSLRAMSRGLVYSEFGLSMAMERQYARWLKGGLAKLSTRAYHFPEWRIATSDCLSGQRTQLVFNRQNLPTSPSARYIDIDTQEIPKAISASTAVPFFFEPVTWQVCNQEVLRLCDGGVLDNQGVRELMAQNAECVCVDASARLGEIKTISGWKTVVRAMDMLMEQTRTDSISSKIELFELRQPTGGSARPEWWQKLMDLRTDLDDFNLIEVDLLFLAGYQSVVGYRMPPAHEALSHSEGVWTLAMESASLNDSEAKRREFDKVLAVLERGKYLWTGGFRVPSVVSVFASLASIYMGVFTSIVIAAYLLVGFLVTTRFLPQWMLQMNFMAFLAFPWAISAFGLMWYHMSGSRRLAGYHPGVVTLIRVLVAPILLFPILAIGPATRLSAFFSTRGAGVFWLVERINKIYGKQNSFKLSRLVRSLKEELGFVD